MVGHVHLQWCGVGEDVLEDWSWLCLLLLLLMIL
jgi:hypothetical protein